MLTIDQIQQEAYATALEKGWHEQPLMTKCIGVVEGHPKRWDQAFVQMAGKTPGNWCVDAAHGGVLCPNTLFGCWVNEALSQIEVLTIYHERVLTKHALMHTELTEAQECIEADDLPMCVEDGKPEGFVVEAADLIIRVCDTTAALGLTLDVDFTRAPSLRSAIEIRQSGEPYVTATLWISHVRCMIDRATEAARIDAWDEYVRRHLSYAVLHTAAIVYGLGCDLDAALTAKMAYNKTRPHRHGGKNA